MEFLIDDSGNAELYDDTYDVVIHCENEEEQTEVIKRMKTEIIRCRECRYRKNKDLCYQDICTHPSGNRLTSLDGFCDKGERDG